MSTLLTLLTGLISIGTFVCFIIVLIKLFQIQGVLHGILGIICGLYTFIWGWIKSAELNIRNIMLIWTGLIVVNTILAFMVSAAQ